MRQEASGIDASVLMRYIRILSDLSGQVRYSTQKRVLVEVALIKLCHPAMERNLDAVLNRLAILEQKVANGVVVASQASGAGIAGGNPEEISGGQQGTGGVLSGRIPVSAGSADQHPVQLAAQFDLPARGGGLLPPLLRRRLYAQELSFQGDEAVPRLFPALHF